MLFQGGIVGIYGEPKTAKTTFALTAPKPIAFFDFDQGVGRAIHRFKVATKMLPTKVLTPTDLDDGDVIVLPLPMPVSWPSAKGVRGMIELAQVFEASLRVACEHPRIRSIVVDTGSLLWLVLHQAYLQQLQMKEPNRTRLQPVEYAVPNAQMRAFLNAIRAYDKNAVLTHHIKDVREEVIIGDRVVERKVGEMWDGWSHLATLVDVLAKTGVEEKTDYQNGKVVKRKVPYLIVERCGWSLSAEGKRLDEPTWDTLLLLVNSERV